MARVTLHLALDVCIVFIVKIFVFPPLAYCLGEFSSKWKCGLMNMMHTPSAMCFCTLVNVIQTFTQLVKHTYIDESQHSNVQNKLQL